MSTIVLYDESVIIPDGITDVDAFRRWAHSEEFPEAGRICFLHGDDAAVRKQGGWIQSQVFGKSFRLSRRIDDEANAEFSLAVR
jgi:hypothetical protein